MKKNDAEQSQQWQQKNKVHLRCSSAFTATLNHALNAGLVALLMIKPIFFYTLPGSAS